ncbi:MAG: STT3 domain-containing protein [Candidatus Pacearchaeota archaeon]
MSEERVKEIYGDIKETIKENTEVKPETKSQTQGNSQENKPSKAKFNINWKSTKLWFSVVTAVVLVAIIIFTIWARTQNIPQLKDVTTGNYTLGPDLDPFLYLRHAKEIVNGTLQEPDIMRAAPHGSANYAYVSLMPWAIVYLYKFLNLFWRPPTATVEFAAIILPVILFSLTLIVFFFFVKKIFSSLTTKTNSTIIALIATVFYAVIPEMLHRTTAGIPEIESLGMLFFWFAFLFFASAWQSDKIKKIVLFAVLAGLSTGLMIFTWGGFRYIFMTFSLATFLIFFFEKQKRKNFLIFTSWLIPSLIFSFFKNLTLENFIKSSAFIPAVVDVFSSITDAGFGLVVFGIMLLDFILFNTKLKNYFEKIKIPKSLISVIGAILIGLIVLIIFNPAAIFGLFSKIVEGFVYPFGRGRIGLTVAENKLPYFVDVLRSFGYLFWVFFFGAMLLFYEATKHFDKKKKTWMNVFFILFFITFIFSRISPQSLLNGENFLSRALYFGGLLLFIIALGYTYINAYVKKDEKTLQDFREINFSYLLILTFIFWMIISMRGAIRLFFIISPAISLGAAFLPVKISEYAFKSKDNLYKIIMFCIVLIATIFMMISLVNYVNATVREAKYTVPGPYEEQWQHAMQWVRENTPKDAIFTHWWDYGYWVQTLGERATVVDGGHAYHNGFWNHLMGREVLTATNENDALEFLYAHNVSYLLIDSTDIGKYGAYSSIGSDETGIDRLSWIPIYVLDEAQTQESKNETAYVYVGGTMLDEDVVWEDQLFPREKAGIAGFIVVIDKEKATISEIIAVLFYNNKQFRVPVKYVYINGQLYDVAKGREALNSTFYIVQRLIPQGINNMGAAMYLSEKVSSSLMAKLYLLNETEHFELVHNEPALLVRQLREEFNATVNDLLVAGDIKGPIKIWKVNYPKDFKVDEAKLKRYMQPNSDLPFILW